MKKILTILIMSFLCYSGVKANSIDSISMDIKLDNEGTAHVTEQWKVNLDQGTEGYKPYYNLGNSYIINFQVSDEKKDYVSQPSWSINGSFSEKAYKNGINYTADGIELCWGISSYGKHTYTLKYDITNFVSTTTDSDIIYWTLIPYDLSSKPGSVYIKIYSDQAFTNDTPVWGYGYGGGYAYVYDGYIEMSTKGKLNSDEYMVVLAKFPKGTFLTLNDIGNDFDYYNKMAKEGSYRNENKINILDLIRSILVTIVPTLIWVGFVLAIFASSKNAANRIGNYTLDYGTNGKYFNKDLPYYRDIPCNKDIFRAYWLARSYALTIKDTDFLGAILLKWLKESKISTETITKNGLLGKKEEKTITFINKDNLTELEVELYDMMYEASKDGKLESKEFQNWCNGNYRKILGWFNKVLEAENKKLLAAGQLTPTTKVTFKIFKSTVYTISDNIYEEAKKMKGLKKFLIDFSNIKDRQVIEVKLWEEYLMYAQIFGIAKKVAEEFKKLYPNEITDMSYNNVIFINNISYSGMSTASSAKSRADSYSSGGGGSSFSGGGGGSFGGGGGGGGFR